MITVYLIMLAAAFYIICIAWTWYILLNRGCHYSSFIYVLAFIPIFNFVYPICRDRSDNNIFRSTIEDFKKL